MKIFAFITAICLLGSAHAAETLIVTGEGFEKDGTTKRFTYERFQSVEGDKVTDRAVYKDLEGEVLTEEKLIQVNGELLRYDMEQKQLKQHAWIERKDGKITFNLKKPRKRNYPQTIDEPENFVVGLSIVPTILKHWDALSKGKEVKITMGVWNRQEAFGFNLSKESSEGKEVVIKMNPASMFVRAVVDPIYFTFDEKKELVSYKGRLTPRDKRGRSYNDIDGVVRFKPVAK